jgi:hypothetical protein
VGTSLTYAGFEPCFAGFNRLVFIQEFEAQYTDANVLLVAITDEESRRLEQQSDYKTKA